MAKDVADVLGTAIGRVAREAAKNVQASTGKRSRGGVIEKVNDAVSDRMNGALSGSKGLAAGAAAATLVPLVAKGAGKLVRGVGGDGEGPVQKLGDKAGDKVKGAVDDQVEKAGGVGGIAKSMLPGGGGKKKKGQPGVGKGRRMPFQWDIDIGVPISTVWEQWTNYEEWPKFMHRLQSASQEDDEHVKFKAKIWGISRDFTAEICEQNEKERIKWKVTEGLTHQGVVTFHELGPRLTRVEVSFDVEPGGMIEKAGRGMRHVKRAARADLARFKAYVLMDDDGSGAEDSEESQGEESQERSSRPRSATKRSSSASSSGNGRSRSGSRPRKQASPSKRGSTSSGRSGSSGRTRASSGGGQKRSASKRSSSSSSNGRSSSSRTKASSSSNGRSSSSGNTRASSSNGRSSSSAKKRASSRS